MKLPGFVEKHSFQLKWLKVYICQLCVKHSLGSPFNPGTLNAVCFFVFFNPRLCGFDGVANGDDVPGHTSESDLLRAQNHKHRLPRQALQSAKLMHCIILWCLLFAPNTQMVQIATKNRKR